MPDHTDDSATQFRKKPVVIDAVQYSRRFRWPEWFHQAVTDGKVVAHGTGKFADPGDECFCEITTLEGVMRGNEGDWIIRGVKGEIYPCKPDIFAATYEPADAQDELTRLRDVEAEAVRLLAEAEKRHASDVDEGPLWGLPAEPVAIRYPAIAAAAGAQAGQEVQP